MFENNTGGYHYEKVPVRIDVSYEKTIFVGDDMEDDEDVITMLDAMDHDELVDILLSSSRHVFAIFSEEYILIREVKEVIDSFDPYILEPGRHAPYDEYDGESDRIAKQIERDMSVTDIAEVIHAFLTKWNKEESG